MRAFVLLTLVAAAVTAAPRLLPEYPARFDASAANLRASLAKLNAAPTREALDSARLAVQDLRRLVDAYFHAPNLRDEKVRPIALALRPRLQRLLSGPEALFVVHSDLVRLRPEVHRALARACAALSDDPCHREHTASAAAIEAETQGKATRR